MDKKYIDLHVHSTASDGTLTPTEVVKLAASEGLSAIALTDHDTIDGIKEAMSVAGEYGIELIPGIEFSTAYEKREVHMLGLFIDPDNYALNEKLNELVATRDNRNEQMAANLRNAGIDITIPALTEMFPNAIITRAHFARYMYEKGYIKDIRLAFDKYIGDGRPCYVRREKISAKEVIDLIKNAGGIPILAHPLLYGFNERELKECVATLTRTGLVGIEAIYSKNKGLDESKVRAVAKANSLLISGGSDFHGANKPGLNIGTGYGHLAIPYEILAELKKAL